LLTRAAPYGADSEPRTSESGCAITYDVLFSRSTRKAWVEAGHPKSKGYGTACTATSDTRAFNPALSAIARSKTAAHPGTTGSVAYRRPNAGDTRAEFTLAQ
jgi:hypothetical protein